MKSNPIEFPPPGYNEINMRHVVVDHHSTGPIDEAFEYVDAAPGPNKYYSNNAEDVIITGVVAAGQGKCFAKLNNVNSGRIAFYYDGTWYFGQGNLLRT